MPSKNSYTYYDRFLSCVEKRFGREKKHYSRWDYVVHLTGDQFKAAIEIIFDILIKKAPSAQMGGDDWLDKFFVHADKILCSGMWCYNERCKDNNTGSPYFCEAGNIPSTCKEWKAWRQKWRSYPEKEECQKCHYFKPYPLAPGQNREEANDYRCLCRAKELPVNCPKRSKGNDNNGKA